MLYIKTTLLHWRTTKNLEKNDRLFLKKRPHKKVEEIRLHRDNARPHVAHTVTKFLEKQGIQTVPHPLYSPDLASCDFWIFPEIKKALCGVRFESNQHVIKAA